MARPNLPNPFAKGQSLKASELEALRNALSFLIQDGGVIAGPGLLSEMRGGKLILSTDNQKRAGSALESGHPFKIRRTGGLFVELDGGMVFSSNRADSIEVGLPEFELTDSITNVIYLQVSIEFALVSAIDGDHLTYHVASATIGHGASLPADTWVDGGAGDGYKYIEIGTVAAAGGVLAKPAQKLYNDYFELASAIRYFIHEVI
jgi:hypothetical protein